MNTSSSSLWQLIQRLTPAEKRYFKTHFASTTNQLSALFDELNSQSHYQEETLKQKLGYSNNHYKVLKAQLHELIIKSLIANYGKKNLLSKIRLGLEEVDILLERELYKPANKKLRQLEQLCTQFGFTLYRYEIVQKMQDISQLEADLQDPLTQGYYEQLQQLEQTLDQKKQLHAIQLELEQWTPFTRERIPFAQKRLAQLEAMPAEYLDFQSNLEWMQCIATCFDILGDSRNAQLYRQQLLDNFAQDATLRERLPLHYLRALKAQVNPFAGSIDLATVQSAVLEAEKLIALLPQYRPHFIYFYWALLQVHFQEGQWQKILTSLANKAVNHIKEYQLHSYRISQQIKLLLGCTALIDNQAQLAESYLNYSGRKLAHKDVALSMANDLLCGVMYWKFQRLDELSKALLSYRRKWQRRGLLQASPLFKACMQLLQQLSAEPNEAHRPAQELLLELSKYNDDPMLFYFSFHYLEKWLQALASNREWQHVISLK